MKEFIKFQKKRGKQTGFSRVANSTITKTLFQHRHKKQSQRTAKITLQMMRNNRLHIVYIITSAFYRLMTVQDIRLEFNPQDVVRDFKVIIICLMYLRSETQLCKAMFKQWSIVRPPLMLLICSDRNTGLLGILISLWDMARFLQRAIQRGSQKNPMSSCKKGAFFSRLRCIPGGPIHSSWGREQVLKKEILFSLPFL